MRMGLATAADGEADMKVVAEAENGLEAIQAYQTHRPDVVVMDLRMPKANGIETILRLRESFGAVRVLVFSNYAGGDEVFQAFKAGACGFVTKEMALERLLDAIRRVHAGEQYIPPEISMRLNGCILSNLSGRELEVLALVAKGLSNKEIGAQLNVVESTIKVHLKNILAKLGVNDRTQAILVAVKRGIIRLE
jgi:DNA-binding NarL/FixJ family response regulator